MLPLSAGPPCLHGRLSSNIRPHSGRRRPGQELHQRQEQVQLPRAFAEGPCSRAEGNLPARCSGKRRTAFFASRSLRPPVRWRSAHRWGAANAPKQPKLTSPRKAQSVWPNEGTATVPQRVEMTAKSVLVAALAHLRVVQVSSPRARLRQGAWRQNDLALRHLSARAVAQARRQTHEAGASCLRFAALATLRPHCNAFLAAQRILPTATSAA